MEATGLSLGKSVLNGTLSYAKSAIAKEVALQLGVQRDQAFITDELEMMLSFLMAAHEEQDDHQVVKTWVKQVRDVAYDVEDCLQDHAVRLQKPSWWRFFQMLVDRHRMATWMKELRSKVEDVSQRNVRYRLIKGAAEPKPASSSAGPSSTIAGASATMFGIEEARRQKEKEKVDLFQLITEGNEDLRVIAVWGTSGVLGQSVVIKREYDALKRSKKFELYAWIRIPHPFNPLEFLQSTMMQFYRTTFEEAGKALEKTSIGVQVLEKMGMMKQDDLFGAFGKHVSENSYLIVLNDLATIEEWDDIKEYFPNCKKGSRIIVSTEHGEVASLCVGQESVLSELKQSSVDQSVFAFFEKVSQTKTTSMRLGSSSSKATIDTNNSEILINEIHENKYVGDNEKTVRKSLTRSGTVASAWEESWLVGREKEKSDLTNLISKQYGHQLVVISVYGMGGIGKTTLVKEVYQSQELSRLFEKRACVTIMRPFVLEEVLQSLAMQLGAKSSESKDEIGCGLVKRKVTEIKYLTEELGKLLERKRSLIVLDDLSYIVEWDMIIQNLPSLANASRIVITTREENIAKYCSANQERIFNLDVLKYMDALDLFTKKVYKEAINLDKHPALIEEANKILEKCNGLPLAIVTIGGYLAKQPKTSMEWRKLNEHISAELEMNPELEIIKTILMKSYDGLPYHLKSCFLYLSIFPKDYNINRRRLVHRWNAEGYLSEVRGKSMGEIAHSYFMELIDRSMVLPIRESIGSRKGISSCKLHDLMREISISKAMEENLVFRMEEGCSLNTQGAIRHLAISSNWEGDQSEFESIVDLSRIRSLTVIGKWKPFYISDNMRLLRVLDMEGTSGLMDHHLEPIWKLLHLKFLSLRDCQGIFHLPESLGNLKQLQTLDVTNTRIIKLPQAITKLRKVQYIRAGDVDNEILGAYTYDELVENVGTKLVRNKICMWTFILIMFCLSSCSQTIRSEALDADDTTNMRDMYDFFCCVALPLVARRFADPGGVVVPRGLRKLKALHTLGVVNIARGKVAILDDIKRLTRLHKLAVTGINKQNCQEFCSTLAHLSSLESLSVHSREEEGLCDCLDGLRSAPKNLQSLKLYGDLGKLPDWVEGLQNLVKLKLQNTNLTDLDGTIQVIGKLPNLAILRLFWYSILDALHFCSRQGAFPSLTVLELDSNTGITSVEFEEGTTPKLEVLLTLLPWTSFTGLSSLPCLKEVLVRTWSRSAPELEDTRTQLARNPNKPILKLI
ncbi:hypothetical protein U9M48_012117 [Paspalum notatum var. saurae]|uniref:Disease resistance protein RPM1 n=1 Tax=Paspalum notatum var. saurae TaxID=547442 RepID=A0AAQ3SXM6_PASNO